MKNEVSKKSFLNELFSMLAIIIIFFGLYGLFSLMLNFDYPYSYLSKNEVDKVITMGKDYNNYVKENPNFYPIGIGLKYENFEDKNFKLGLNPIVMNKKELILKKIFITRTKILLNWTLPMLFLILVNIFEDKIKDRNKTLKINLLLTIIISIILIFVNFNYYKYKNISLFENYDRNDISQKVILNNVEKYLTKDRVSVFDKFDCYKKDPIFFKNIDLNYNLFLIEDYNENKKTMEKFKNKRFNYNKNKICE